jgi:hypothetical protein
VVHPDVRKQEFQIGGFDDAIIRHFGRLTHIRFIIGTGYQTAGYKLNFGTVNQGLVAPSNGVVMDKW